jgi:hypothetical protein
MVVAVLSMANIAAAQSINVISPINNSKFTTTIVPISYGVITDNPNDICWYSVGNAAGIPLSCFNNTFNAALISGNNILTLYINRFNLTNMTNITIANSVLLIVDNTAPYINISNPVTSTYYGNNTLGLNNLTFTISDPNCAVYWVSNGTTNITNPSPCINTTLYNLYMLTGSNTWTVYANDTFGNTASSAISFTYDPVYPVLNTVLLEMLEDSIRLNYETNEAVIVTVRYGLNSTNMTNTINTTSFDSSSHIHIEDLLNNTRYFYNITIADRAYNRVAYGPYNFTFNSTIPVVVANCYTDAICSQWGPCNAVGLQTRTCNKILINCSYSVVPITTQACNYTIQTTTPLTTSAPPATTPNTTTNSTSSGIFGGLSDGAKILLIIICIIVLISVAVFLYFRYQNPASEEIKDRPYDQTYDPTQDPKYSRGTSYSTDPDDYLADEYR